MRAWKTLVIAGGLASASAESITVPVVVFNNARVPSNLLSRAERHYSEVLGRAGVDVQWIHPEPGSREVRVESPPIVVYLSFGKGVRPTRTRTGACLGRAIVKLAAGRPSYSAVLHYDEITAVAHGRGADIPLILGHVIAHETGHLLLGEAHSVSGIMKASWSKEELSEIKRGLAVFTNQQATELRSKISGLKTVAAQPRLP